jgi:HSP20 family protein
MALPTRLVRALSGDTFDSLGRDFEQVMQRLASRDGGFFTTGGYAVDIWETPDHLHVEAELPGFKREEIDVLLENQVLTITAERKADEQAQQRDWLLNERRAVRFSRSFSLPPTVDESKCEAKYENGVLLIALNKREESKPRKISVT